MKQICETEKQQLCWKNTPALLVFLTIGFIIDAVIAYKLWFEIQKPQWVNV